MKKLLSALLILALPVSAVAETGYASLSYVFASVQPEDAAGSARVNAIQFGFGGWLNPQSTLGAEARAGLGFNDDRARFSSGDSPKVEIDRYYGGYFRAQFPETLPVRPYGLFGFTRVETSERLSGDNSSESYNDISLGLGLDLTLDHNIFANLEYLRAVDRGTREVSFLSLGIGGRF